MNISLGYHAQDRRIIVADRETQTVRHIFRRHLELGSLNLLLADMRADGITTRTRLSVHRSDQ